ncbi:MAG TPA: hypothetical protein VKI17_01540, partial [Gemmataceae bacterium]|nr:hypothetical protein [Gemmataceae bacterium]
PRSEARATRKEQTAPPEARSRPQPKPTQDEEKARRAGATPSPRDQQTRTSEQGADVDVEIVASKESLSRREVWLLALGVALGAGAILVAGGLGLLLAHALK